MNRGPSGQAWGMWLALVAVAVIAGSILGIAGAGIFAVPIVIVLLGAAMFLFMKQSADSGQPEATTTGMASTGATASGSPQDTTTEGTHKVTGHAHGGQEHVSGT